VDEYVIDLEEELDEAAVKWTKTGTGIEGLPYQS
jgi:hypothetical protein